MSSSKLAVGIVGLPNVGKSTLFNALLKKQASFAEASAGQAGSGGAARVGNFPFTTIEPNVGVVPVPDDRLEKLADVVEKGDPSASLRISRPPVVPAVVQFVDIAGLIAGAHKGEGLGNKFLAHIREVDLICHVLRAFRDPDIVKQGVVNPKSDFETVKTELDLADLETIDRRKKKEKKDEIKEELPLLSKKSVLVVLNVDEEDLKKATSIEESGAKELGVDRDQVVAICAKVESELSGLSEEDQKEYLLGLGTRYSGLERLIEKAYKTLGLISFLTAGEKEVRAWTVKNVTAAVDAAGVIHTDFSQKFIKVDVVDFEDFIEYGGWKKCRELGKVRSEGRDYIVQDGDVIEFKVGN